MERTPAVITQEAPETGMEFPARPEYLREAREYARGLIPDCPLTDDIVLCVSELAANAIQHTLSGRPGGVFSVRVVSVNGWVRVQVQDQGGPWRIMTQPTDDDVRGRGLRIVHRLADEFGVFYDTDTGNRVVWFEIAV
jgi:serine/threonine-protein kinase RsbW